MNTTKQTISEQLVSLSTFHDNTHVFKAYLGEIFRHLVKRNYPKNQHAVNFFQFHEYLNLPMLISQKLINTFGKDSILRQEEFIEGLYTLFCGQIEPRIQLMLKFFDFQSKEIIYADDILLIFSHFHMMYNRKGINILHDLVQSALQGKKSFALSELSHVINVTNSDILFLFLFYFMKAKPFHEDQLIFFWRNRTPTENECLGVKPKSAFATIERFKVDEHSEVIAPPSEKLLSYLHEFMGCDITAPTRTEIEESFSELEYLASVEEDMSGMLNEFKKDAEIFNVIKLIHQDSLKNPCTQNVDRRNILQSNNSNDSSTQFSDNFSSGGDYMQGYITLYSIGKKNNLQKCKVSIVKDNLFYFKQDMHTNAFQMKKIISLKSIFIKDCDEFTLHNKKYFAVKLIYNFDHLKKGYAFASTDENEIITLKSLIKTATNFKRLEEEYILGCEIGKGQFGKVKLCVNKNTGEQCAVKTLHKSKVKSKDIQMLKWEMDIFKLFKNANHPNLIRSMDIYETPSLIHFVYEYVPYNLNTYLQTKKEFLSPTELKCMMCQLVSAVHFFHFFGIVHRDLKLDNILVDVDKDNSIQLKIIDFGLSKVIGRHETTREPYGSLCYAAPEILCQIPYSHKVDIWSLGVIAYYLRYGILPFDDSSNDLGKIIKLVIQGNFEMSSNEKADYDYIRNIIISCLNTHYQKRAGIEELIEIVNNN